MRFCSWARSYRLVIQYYPPTSVCCSSPSFSIKLATDLQILKNGANIGGSVAEPEAVGSVSSIIHPPQSVSLPSFGIKLGTDLQVLKNGANIWGSVAEPGAIGWVVAARLLVLLGCPPFTLNTVQCFQLRLNLHLKQQSPHIFMCSTQKYVKNISGCHLGTQCE